MAMGYLLDTNHCIYLMNALGKSPSKHKSHESNVLSKFNTTTDPLYTSILVLAELYYGAVNSKQQASNLARIALLKPKLNVLGVPTSRIERASLLMKETLLLL